MSLGSGWVMLVVVEGAVMAELRRLGMSPQGKSASGTGMGRCQEESNSLPRQEVCR